MPGVIGRGKDKKVCAFGLFGFLRHAESQIRANVRGGGIKAGVSSHASLFLLSKNLYGR